MNYNRRFFRLAATAAAVLFAAAVASAQAHEHGQMQAQAQGNEQLIKVGKKGDITLSQETMVGDLKLPAGDYQVQHRIDGSDHLIHFKQRFSHKTGGVKAHPGEVKCRLEPLNQKVTQTTVLLSKEDGMMRITRIEISGENVAHVF